MKEIVKYYENNKWNKFLVSSDDIKTKMNKILSFSVFKVLKKQIEEVLGDDKVLFGLEEIASGMIFTENYFLICGGSFSGGLKKFDYRVFSELSLRPKTFSKKGVYLLNDEPTFGLGTTKTDFITSFNDLKTIISEMEFDTSKPTHYQTQHRSINLFGIGGVKNMFERYSEQEMNPWEIEEIQKSFQIKIVELDQLNELISNREKEILEKNNGHEYLQKFIRLKKVVTQKREIVINNLNIGKEDKWLIKSNLMNHLENLEKDNITLETFYNVSVYLVSNFVNEKMVDFFEIYEKIDELGVFNSSYENKLINELGSINEKLGSINSKLTYLNMVTTYNTFQLRTIKRKL